MKIKHPLEILLTKINNARIGPYLLLLLMFPGISACHKNDLFVRSNPSCDHLIIVTLDGFRWQELFGGVDHSITASRPYPEQLAVFDQYAAATAEESRKKLLPFIWGKIGTEGQIYGNRHLGNKVNTANRYGISYPGYSEIFCGYADNSIRNNSHGFNKNPNALAFLNARDEIKGKVAVFGSWNAFERILNEPGNGLPVICGNELFMFGAVNPAGALMSDLAKDSLLHLMALDYVRSCRPRVLYLAYGNTDEMAHLGVYEQYLSAAHHADEWLSELWNFIQNDPVYGGRTTLLVTTDHGRGNSAETWSGHGERVEGSREAWFAVIGPGIKAKGEMKTEQQFYLNQLAQTFTRLLGYSFTPGKQVAGGLTDVLYE